MQCPNCGAFAGPDELFCGECGARLPRPTPAGPPATPAPAAPRRERGFPLWIPLGIGGCAVVVAVGCLALIALGGVGALLVPGAVPVAQATATHTPRPPSPTRRPTDTPLPPPTITPQTDVPVYLSDFSQVTSDWATSSGATYSREYVNGEYHITLKLANTVYRSMLQRDWNLKDFTMQVDARLVEGPTIGAYALVFRYRDQDNHYIFRVLPSGHYWLSKREGGQWTSLIGKTESVYIHQGQATNRLRVECAGYWIRLYVNDRYLNAALDNSFSAGQIGLAVSTWDDPGFHAAFDDFKVWEQ